MPVDLSCLEPAPLWRRFAEICAIPHPSGGEERLAAWIEGLASSAGLESERDAAGNLLVRKPAAPGGKRVPAVVLQSHLDMVPQKAAGKDFDFEKDPIVPVVEDGWVAAEGTTLGADNGIGVAAMLAVMEAEIPDAGPIDLLFTVKEEIGLLGAMDIDESMIKADILINLDSEDVSTVIIGCAGGRDVEFRLRPRFEKAPGDEWRFLAVSLGGLEGGHSGVDAHLRRGNAIIELAKTVFGPTVDAGGRVAAFEGGSLPNAIPRDASIVLAVPDGSDIESALDGAACSAELRLASTDPGARFEFADTARVPEFLDSASSERLLRLLAEFPDGPFETVLEDGREVVESSSNLGSVAMDGGEFLLRTMQRGVSDNLLDAASERVAEHALELGCEPRKGPAFPPWPPSRDSNLLKLVADVFERRAGVKPAIEIIHAGLECGVIGSKRAGMDMVSIGPTIKHPHSPKERVEIRSVDAFCRILMGIISSLGVESSS